MTHGLVIHDLEETGMEKRKGIDGVEIIVSRSELVDLLQFRGPVHRSNLQNTKGSY